MNVRSHHEVARLRPSVCLVGVALLALAVVLAPVHVQAQSVVPDESATYERQALRLQRFTRVAGVTTGLFGLLGVVLLAFGHGQQGRTADRNRGFGVAMLLISGAAMATTFGVAARRSQLDETRPTGGPVELVSGRW